MKNKKIKIVILLISFLTIILNLIFNKEFYSCCSIGGVFGVIFGRTLAEFL